MEYIKVTEYTKNIVCPYCGHEDHDSWEVDFGGGMEGEEKLECGTCGKEFIASKECSITYSTRRL